ncbi:hypothetical protein PROFUN_16224 [Planoprotostelium fungivorum]|uniref:Uncharacterized protein n=1 Tax=Planoprotostelium fungivorum TaxID=1890364 RepID=A0A2P6MS10_9EUKA|nr:hypothetical protein PROFUN_16224 [Planoprotostelium fungivorum]
MVCDNCPLFNFTFRQPALYGVNVPLQSIRTPSNMTCNTSPAFAYGWNNVVVSSTVLYGNPTQAQMSNGPNVLQLFLDEHNSGSVPGTQSILNIIVPTVTSVAMNCTVSVGRGWYLTTSNGL